MFRRPAFGGDLPLALLRDHFCTVHYILDSWHRRASDVNHRYVNRRPSASSTASSMKSLIVLSLINLIASLQASRSFGDFAIKQAFACASFVTPDP
jgi:hypothetical protein